MALIKIINPVYLDLPGGLRVHYPIGLHEIPDEQAAHWLVKGASDQPKDAKLHPGTKGFNDALTGLRKQSTDLHVQAKAVDDEITAMVALAGKQKQPTPAPAPEPAKVSEAEPPKARKV